jgi:hypothetical protein
LSKDYASQVQKANYMDLYNSTQEQKALNSAQSINTPKSVLNVSLAPNYNEQTSQVLQRSANYSEIAKGQTYQAVGQPNYNIIENQKEAIRIEQQKKANEVLKTTSSPIANTYTANKNPSPLREKLAYKQSVETNILKKEFYGFSSASLYALNTLSHPISLLSGIVTSPFQIAKASITGEMYGYGDQIKANPSQFVGEQTGTIIFGLGVGKLFQAKPIGTKSDLLIEQTKKAVTPEEATFLIKGKIDTAYKSLFDKVIGREKVITSEINVKNGITLTNEAGTSIDVFSGEIKPIKQTTNYNFLGLIKKTSVKPLNEQSLIFSSEAQFKIGESGSLTRIARAKSGETSIASQGFGTIKEDSSILTSYETVLKGKESPIAYSNNLLEGTSGKKVTSRNIETMKVLKTTISPEGNWISVISRQKGVSVPQERISILGEKQIKAVDTKYSTKVPKNNQGNLNVGNSLIFGNEQIIKSNPTSSLVSELLKPSEQKLILSSVTTKKPIETKLVTQTKTYNVLVNKQITLPKNIQKSIKVVETTTNQENKQTQKNILSTTIKSNTAVKSITTNLIKNSSSSVLKNIQTPKLDTEQKQTTEIKQEMKVTNIQKQISTSIHVSKTTPFLAKKHIKLLTMNLSSSGKNKGNGFDVFMRKGGKWFKANTGALVREEAFNFGLFRASNTARASFKLIPSNEKVSSNFIGLGGNTFNFHRKGNVWIQNANKRISTQGEKEEITFKGLAMLKNKSIFGK